MDNYNKVKEEYLKVMGLKGNAGSKSDKGASGQVQITKRSSVLSTASASASTLSTWD